MIPEQIWDMIKWSVIILVAVSAIGYWTERIINFLTEDTEDEQTE